MDSLLRWGIENSDTNAPPPSQRLKDLDPGIIDMILGKPDSVLMKESLAIGLDETAAVDARVTALDNFEMLVEQIDNAKNLTPLQMYPPLLSLLSEHQPDEVRMQSLWILGTAVQNNPEAQADFLKYDPIPLILSILSPSHSTSNNQPSSQTRSKAAYALSSTVKQSAEGVKRLEEAGGWEILRCSLQDSDVTIRRKTVFMINTLLLPTAPTQSLGGAPHSSGPLLPGSQNTDASQNIHQPHIAVEPVSTTLPVRTALQKYHVIPVLVDSLISPLPHGPDADQDVDPDYAEKAAQTLITYLEVGGVLWQDEKEKVSGVLKDHKIKESWALDGEAWNSLQKYMGN